MKAKKKLKKGLPFEFHVRKKFEKKNVGTLE